MRRTSWIAVLVVVILGAAVGITAGNFLSWYVPLANITHTGFAGMFSKPFGGRRYVRLLMMGVDNSGHKDVESGGLTDTLVAMAIDMDTKNVRAISIPRDTKVDIPGHRTGKINSAHQFGGPALAQGVVESLLGVKMDYFVKIDIEGLVKLVDLLGGVYVIVERNMNYDDNRGNLHIHLKGSKEKQLLDGKQAMGYVRFRHDVHGDTGWEIIDGKKVPAGRIYRQQKFMRSLANRVLSLPTRRRRAAVMQEAFEKKYIDSNLNMVDWDGMIEFFKDFDPETIKMDILPGSPGRVGRGSYWLPDAEETARLVGTNLLFQYGPSDAELRIQVQNGSGKAGAAQTAANQIIASGFPTVTTGNAPSFDYDTAIVTTRVGQTDSIRRLASIVGTVDIREEQPSPDEPDVTIIIGRNYASRQSREGS